MPSSQRNRKNNGLKSVVILISGLLAIQGFVVFVEAEITFVDGKGISFLLDGYQAHEQLMTSVESVIGSRIKESLAYSLRHSAEGTSSFLSNIDHINYALLNYFHSVLSNEISITNIFTGYFPQGSPVFTNWLTTKINIPAKDVYKVVERLSRGKEIGLSSIPNFVLKEVLKMNEKYDFFGTACSTGNTQVVEWALESGLSLEEIGLKALGSAWEGKRWDVVKILIANKGFPFGNITRNISCLSNDKNETPLHFAAETDNVESVLSLLKAGANIDAQDVFGKTPLQRAIEASKMAAVNSLISSGSNINHETKSADSLLHVAAINGNHEVVKLLLKEGFSLERKNQEGLTPLQVAERTALSIVLDQLLDQCADFTSSKHTFYDLLEMHSSLKRENACVRGRFKGGNRTILRNITAVLKLLMKKGARSNLSDENKSALLSMAIEYKLSDTTHFLLATKIPARNVSLGLHKAALNNDVQTMAYLLAAGADKTLTNLDGWKAIHVAAARGNLEAVKFLLKKGDDVNSRTVKNETSLHIAASEGRMDVARFLIEKGANINAEAARGKQPIHFAAEKGKAKLLELLLQKGADPNARDVIEETALFGASRSRSVEAVKELLDNGADSKARSLDGSTPLHAAVWGGDPEVVSLLLNRGANIDAKNSFNKTALFEASYYGIQGAVEVLLSRGADARARAIGCWTALHIASRGGFAQIVRLLLDSGADTNVMTDTKATPLYEAALHGHAEVVNLLIGKGADVNAANLDGETPLKAARKKHFGNVVNILKNNGALETP